MSRPSAPSAPSPARPSTVGRAARTALRLLGLAGGFGVLSAYRFRVRHEARALPGLQRPVRVAFLADMHYGNFIGARSVRAWVRATVRAQPDLILFGGDFLDTSFTFRSRGALLRELQHLRAPLGVYAVFGNHDWTSLTTHRARGSFAAELEKLGIRVINNAGVRVREDLFVAGVDDWWFGNQDVAAALRECGSCTTLLLSHNPDFLPFVPDGVALTLSGHTHGGQVDIPFMGPVKQASLYGTEFLAGWVSAAAAQPNAADESVAATPPRVNHGFVTNGLGVTGVPVRLNCPAEVVLFEFTPAP
ncbi:metallophosphoesterase [Deinococcus maricopensis]|uniref:Metallophosphoesterase n=1 Tax=Deinococcus maricopensis (strain DSM 21211 / LMG 22137 / NRRL B-23946 / LB-34) TaxID=709986 RepID=E8U630_DEIML|nr:metallophosphoesterase [Deinococcus maricopensis]ADV66519.1 metallophosphoesterase [Deinococcus maricopensis DSM 21211]